MEKECDETDCVFCSGRPEKPSGCELEWSPISWAPEDGTPVLVLASGEAEGLPDIECVTAFHPETGFCIDELRVETHFKPIVP